jgi:hypothetical protein
LGARRSDSAITQGVGVATGMQKEFSWAGVAAAGVTEGYLARSGASKRTVRGQLHRFAARVLINASVRSLIDGTDFGDNVIAALPSAVTGAFGDYVQGDADAQAPETEEEWAAPESSASAPPTYGLVVDERGIPREPRTFAERMQAYTLRYLEGGAHGNTRPQRSGWDKFWGAVGDFFGADGDFLYQGPENRRWFWEWLAPHESGYIPYQEAPEDEIIVTASRQDDGPFYRHFTFGDDAAGGIIWRRREAPYGSNAGPNFPMGPNSHGRRVMEDFRDYGTLMLEGYANAEVEVGLAVVGGPEGGPTARAVTRQVTREGAEALTRLGAGAPRNGERGGLALTDDLRVTGPVDRTSQYFVMMADDVPAIRHFTRLQGSRSFDTYEDFRAAFGSAGDGADWHHIVEQYPELINRFGARTIQNTDNIVQIDRGVHTQISAFYSSKQPFTNGSTFRDWLYPQPIEVHREWGEQLLLQFGGGR